MKGDLEAIRRHIQAGSNLNEKDRLGGSSPLIIATTFGHTEVASALIDAGADVDQTNNEGSTALHTAALFCHAEIVESLLTGGANKNARNNAGATALDLVSGPFDAMKGTYDSLGAFLKPSYGGSTRWLPCRPGCRQGSTSTPWSSWPRPLPCSS